MDAGGASRSFGFSATACARLRQSWELSYRQLQVVLKLVEGATVEELADSLGISLGTANTHLRRLHRKLGIHRRSVLIRRAVECLKGR